MQYQLKILSGPMYGVELDLPAEDIFFVVGNESVLSVESDLTHHAFEHATRTLYIPFTAQAANFLLRLSTMSSSEVSARIFLEGAERETELVLNQVLEMDGVRIALKKQNQAWSPDVLETSLPVVIPDIDTSSSITPEPVGWLPRANITKLAAGLALILFVIGLGLIGLKINAPSLYKVSEALSNTDVPVGQNQKGIYYVFAKNASDVFWVRRELERQGIPANAAEVVDKTAECTRILSVLEKHGFPAFTVNLDDVKLPRILLVQTTTAKFYNTEAVSKLLKEEVPYAQKFDIQVVEQNMVLRQAREQLNNAGVLFNEKSGQAQWLFMVQGALKDTQLIALNENIENFYKKWGKTRIQFLVNLSEEALRNKSYRTGSNGYVVEEGKKWVFSEIDTQFAKN